MSYRTLFPERPVTLTGDHRTSSHDIAPMLSDYLRQALLQQQSEAVDWKVCY